MAYYQTGKIDDDDPQNLFPAAAQMDPSLIERMVKGIRMDFPNANVRDSRQPYPLTEAGGGSGTVQPVQPAQPFGVPLSKDPGSVLPPIAMSAPPRNYLAEVEASDRNFNAERDTPNQTAAQAAYVPPMQATRTNPWNQGVEHPRADPLQTVNTLRQQYNKSGQASDLSSLQEHEKGLVAQVKAMLPGASPKELRSVLSTISRTVQPQVQASAGPQTLEGAVNSATTQQPNYQKLGAGQSIYQMNPDGSAKLVTTAPGGASAGREEARGAKNIDNSIKMYAPIKKEYDRRWDKITEDITDPKERTKALHGLNTSHFQSLGVPDELASVPVSFRLWLEQQQTPEAGPNGEAPIPRKLSREQTQEYEKIHKKLVSNRNQFLNRFWGNNLQFGGRGGTK